MLKNVVSPAPFGPIRLMIEPSGIVKSTSLTATRPPNSLRTPSAVSRSAIRRVPHVVEGLVRDTLLELRLAAGARDQALRLEQHHEHENRPEDPVLVERHVDVRSEGAVDL